MLVEPKRLPTCFDPELRGALPDAQWNLLLQHLASRGIDTDTYAYVDGAAGPMELVLGQANRQARVAIDYRDGLVYGVRITDIDGAGS